MKQKIVIKVHIRCDKCRKKAMKIAASARGVISVTIQGNEKDEIVVIGEEVDSAGLCTALRKKLGHANLMSVEEVKPPKPVEKPAEKPAEKKPEKEEKKPEKEENKQEEKKEKKEEANKSESKPSSTPEATIIYHHYPPNCPTNYPPPNYCYPNNPPQCYMVTTQYEDNSNCTIM